MKLQTGVEYFFVVKKEGVPMRCCLVVYVEPRAEKLNPETGEVISRQALYDAVHDALEPFEEKEWTTSKQLQYLPHTLESVVIRIWEWLEETIPTYAKLSKIKLSNDQYFVTYKSRTPYKMKRK